MFNRSRLRPDLKAIGLRIRILRGDVRQQDFARELGLSQSQLSKVERGRIAPTLEVLLAISNRFGKSLDWIVRGAE